MSTLECQGQVELKPAELSALLSALRLDALAASSSARNSDAAARRALGRRAEMAERLRHAVARGCGPIAATTTLDLSVVERQAVVRVLLRLQQRVDLRHPWGISFVAQHKTHPAALACRLQETTT